MSPPDYAHNMALQKYMLLQEQHQTLSYHLDQIRPATSTSGTANYLSTFSSPSVSPTRCASLSPTSSISSASSTSSSISPSRRHSRSGDRQHKKARARSSGMEDSMGMSHSSLDTITDEDTLHQISEEEARLWDVNEGIKRALMELLGCESVRRDGNMRMWVQKRLMETEQELRMGRRRRSA